MKLLFIMFFLFAFACQGMPSNKPPIHLNPNMDNQERFDPQEENSLFENKMSMRTPVKGTIPRGYLYDDMGYHLGKNKEESNSL